MPDPDEKKPPLARLLQTLDLATRSVIPGLIVLALCLLFLFPLSWVEGIAGRVGERLHALGVEFKGGEFNVGPLKFGLNPRTEVVNMAALQGAEAQVQQALATPDPRDARRQLAALAEDLAAGAERIKTAQAERARDLARQARPAAAPVTAWVYVGRLDSGGRWAPVADDVTPEPRGGNPREVAVRANTMLFSSLAESAGGPLQMVRNDARLAVLEVRHEDAIGAGKLVWAKVEVPAADVLELRQP